MDETTKSDRIDRELSQRLYRALTSGGDELFQVLQDPSQDVLQAALKNPALGEGHLLALLKRRDLNEELLKLVSKAPISGESHAVKVALVHHPNTPGSQLLALLPQLYLFELVTICSLPGTTPDQRLAAERAIIQRLPTTPLGNRLTLARRATATVMQALLKEGDPRIFEACLGNPHLKEGAIFQFLNCAAATADTISMVARHPRWQTRPNLKLAILKNPRTPLIWYNLWLPNLPAGEVKNLLSSQRLSGPQKKAVKEELNRRGLPLPRTSGG